ncbi:Nucleoporin SEH1 [Nucella lapillus]
MHTNPCITHSGSVWRVSWAHPDFGQVLATCSFDRTAAVWEKEAGQNHWLKRTSLVDSRTSVTDVKFAPKHLGLQLVKNLPRCSVIVFK